MNHGLQPKSRLAYVTFARKLLCLNRAGSILNITSQCQDPEILFFCYKSVIRKFRSHAETPVSKFRSDISVRLRDISEKQVSAKLKPIEVPSRHEGAEHHELASKVWSRVASGVSSIQEAPGGQEGPGDSIP